MKRPSLFFITILLLSQFGVAACYDPVVTEKQPPIVECLYKQWKAEPTRANLTELLHPLFYVYLSDGNRKALHNFFDDLRREQASFKEVESFKRYLVRRYTFPDETLQETAASWAMPPVDARAMFLLFQIHPESLPDEISNAMQIAIYDQIQEAYFKSNLHRQFGYFPPSEYLRLQEILKRLSWVHDPYLKSLNGYYQGIVLLNLAHNTEGRDLLLKTRADLENCLINAEAKLAQKRILSTVAQLDLVLGNLTDAEQDYVWILRIDPQDWNALMNLSFVLNEQKECPETSVWVEATIRSDQEFFDVVLHCGSQELVVPENEPTSPVIASLRSAGRSRLDPQS